MDGMRFRAVRLTPRGRGGEVLDLPWLGVACRDEDGTRLWLETAERPPLPGDGYDVALWADIPEGGLGEVVVRDVDGLRLWAVGLGYVSLYGGPGTDLVRTRVPGPPAGVVLGDDRRPGAWTAASQGQRIADECRATESARQRRRAAVAATRRERRTVSDSSLSAIFP